MRPKKPLSEFTLDALLACKESFKGCISHTEELINEINNLHPDSNVFKLMDEIAVINAQKAGASISGFIELAQMNLQDFKLHYDLVLEELARRQQ